MASYSWTTGVSGDWNTATNWTPATVPNGAAADVTIDAVPVTPGIYTVTIAAGETQTVHSLTINGVNNLAGTNAKPYNAAQFAVEGTLIFDPTSNGVLGSSLQTFMVVNGGTIVNAGTVDAFIQGQGNVLFTGTNGFYVTNWLQSLAGTVTIDTSSIAEITGNVLFDGIYEAKGPGAIVHLGGPLQKAIINIATIEGPPLIPSGWTELLLNDPTAIIDQWDGAKYVNIESTLKEIGSRGTLDVTAGRNYATANTLTVDAGGLLNLQAGQVTTAGLNINGGTVQGFAIVGGPVVNNGTIRAVGGTLDITGALTGTGVVTFDFDQQTTVTSTTGSTFEVGSVSAGQTIVMTGKDTLQLDNPAAFLGTIQAGVGDKIVLGGVSATGATFSNGTLVVSNGAQTVASLKLSGSYTGDTFTTNGSVVSIGGAGGGGTNHFTITDTTTNLTTSVPGEAYTGSVSGLEWQYVSVTTDSLAITATAPNSFIHTGSGNDAIDVSKVNGTNVLDGSTGSNFLVGGTGFDTFFLDNRDATADVFSTVVGFNSGDNATVFGVTPTDFTLNIYDNQGAAGYTGLDFSFSAAGKANANLVLTGFNSADLTNGKLSVTYGTTTATTDAPAATYMLIHAN